MSKVLRKEYSNLGFDPDELRAKYLAERDKRLRSDGNQQYVQVTGAFEHLTKDPYAPKDFERDPLTREVELVVIGGGFAGMMAGARSREAGIDDLLIIEGGSDFGGTWYWNRFPGSQCDIESYIYLPLLEELGYMPKEKYSYASEIYEHSQRIAKHFNLYDAACFQTRVTDLTWDENDARWQVGTNHNDDIRARFVIMATGGLNRPKLPAVPGLEDFKGHTFHTSRWDYDYTGGDTNGNLDKLADKKVAIIGTGATAIQCIPFLGQSAEHLYVLQRTPSSVDVRGNAPTDPEWAKSLKPGWQRARRDNFCDMVAGRPVEKDLVNDGWTAIFRDLDTIMPKEGESDVSAEEASELAEIADFRKMIGIRDRVDNLVDDQETAEALKPWYRQFCKRPCFNDEYLPTFNRDNVTLIDTSDSQGVERLTEKGFISHGVEYEVDCIIFSTGFEVGTPFTQRSGFEVRGQDGKTLSDYWADGLKTLHGHSAHGFPNCFKIGLGQNGLSPNMTAMMDDQSQHIVYIINEVKKRGVRYVQPTLEAESEWVQTIQSSALLNRDFFEACTPGYFNSEGKFGEVGGLISDAYGPGVVAFNKLLAEWRAKGDLAGLELG